MTDQVRLGQEIKPQSLQTNKSEWLFVDAIISAAILLIVALIGFAIPAYIRKDGAHSNSFRSNLLNYANAFSGGVMVSAGFLHLLGEAAEQLKDYDYPIAELCCALGYLFTLIAETISQFSIQSPKTSKSSKPRCETLPGGPLPMSTQHASLDNGAACCESVKLLVEAKVEGGESDSHNFVPVSMSLKPFSSLMLLIGLSFHSVLEGLAIGSQGDIARMGTVLLAVLLHKGLVAFVLSSMIIDSQMVRQRMVLAIFALASPIGIITGAVIQYYASKVGSDALWESVPSAIASGTFIYISITEIIPRTISGKKYQAFMSIVFLLLGFGIMSVLRIWT